MVNKNKEIEIIWKMNPSSYEKINADVYSNPPLRLGSKISSVDRMINMYGNEMTILLPSIIGVNPLDNNWYKAVKTYWDSVSYEIPTSGKKLEIGFSYDLNAYDKQTAIKELVAKNKNITTDETFATYCETNLKEEELCRYAKPINIKDYLMYRYCLVDSDVANTLAESNNSTRIKFVIANPKEKQDFKRKAHALETKANSIFIESLKDEQTVTNLLYSLGIDVTNLDIIDKEIKLKELSSTNFEHFIAIASDKNLNIRARIERYIIQDVLKRLPDSSIIVDAKDITYTVGGNIDEAIGFFLAEDAIKIAKVKEFALRAKEQK